MEELLGIEVGWDRRRLAAQLEINIQSILTEYFTIIHRQSFISLSSLM